MADIKDIGAAGKVQLELPEAKKARGPSDSKFQETLKAYLEGVDKLQAEADKTVTEVASGKTDNIHQAMVAMEKADVSFKLMVEARNRIVKAYEEILKMQI